MKKMLIAGAMAMLLSSPAHAWSWSGNLSLDLARAASAVSGWFSNNNPSTPPTYNSLVNLRVIDRVGPPPRKPVGGTTEQMQNYYNSLKVYNNRKRSAEQTEMWYFDNYLNQSPSRPNPGVNKGTPTGQPPCHGSGCQ